MSWESFFFADGMDRRVRDVDQRKTWATVQYSGMDAAEKSAGLAFAASLGGDGNIGEMAPRIVKSGQFFLHREGKYSAITKDAQTGRLRWLDVSGPKGNYVSEDVGGEAIGRAIDLDGNWMRVADSKDEFIKLQLDGRLGSNDTAREYWGVKK